MPYIQLNEQQFPLRVGQLRIGAGAAADVRVPGADDDVQAIVELSADQHVLIRRARESAVVRVNGVPLAAEPSPLIHGDKIEVLGAEMRFGDDKKGGSTQFVSSADFSGLLSRPSGAAAGKPTAATGGRLVSLVDGREYAIGGAPLIVGRDAGCDVVVPATEVSRQHASIGTGDDGYVLTDLSTNGVFVNGERVQRSRTLGRADVVRVGNEEFRFYADAAVAAADVSVGAAEATRHAVPAPERVAASAPDSNAAGAPAGGRSGGRGDSRSPLIVLEIVNEGPTKGQQFAIHTPLANVGRGEHNDVILDDESVSDSHAKIQKREQHWYVMDLDSTNGTYLAGRRITGERELMGSPDLRFGGVKMSFRANAEAAGDSKGTKVIVGADLAEQARRRAASTSAAAKVRNTPPAHAAAPEAAQSSGLPGWAWPVGLIVAALAAAAAFLL